MGVRSLAPYAVLLAAWWAAGLVSPLVPTPLEVAERLLDPRFDEVLIHAYLLTAARASAGYLLGVGLGLGLAVLAALLRVEAGLEPLAALLASVPPVAWIPVLIAVMGVGPWRLPVAAAVLASLPVVLHDALSGLRGLDAEEVGVARSLGARGAFLWRTVVLPRLVERLLPAAKIEAIMAWKVVFVTEMVAVTSGLGYLAMVYADTLDTPGLFAVVALLTATVAGRVRLLTLIEERVLRARGLGVEARWLYA